MCGIVGIYLKNSALEPRLGQLFEPMLVAMTGRGPDSAGFALYNEVLGDGGLKLTLQHLQAGYNWQALSTALEQQFGVSVSLACNDNTATLSLQAAASKSSGSPQQQEPTIRAYLREHHPAINILSAGRAIQIYKETGLPQKIANQFNLSAMTGSHVIGHTRMATESAVTIEGSHPFSTGMDLCLVHNGSFSNHNRLREELRREGIEFQTDNDTEVAAGYLSWRLREGDDLETALNHALKDLDGFYTLTIGTQDGFAVVRDPIACKPAILAETDDYVAMASEYQALSHLPGIEQAKLWEPEPATVYTWNSQAA